MDPDERPNQTGAGAPSRLVVELQELAIVSVDEANRCLAGSDLWAISGDGTIESIRDEVLPDVVEGRLWTGELRLAPLNPSASDLEQPGLGTPTVWIPHHVPGQPVTHATVLLGVGANTDHGRVALDPLTGLPTRLVLLDRLDVARRRSRRNDDLMATLFVDLDGLKAINDRLGHDRGDSALQTAASRIRSCLRDGDTVARFGGDEFVVLCESLNDQGQAERVAQRILKTLMGERHAPLSASIGIAYDQGGTIDTLELIARSDAAMYRAKSQGGGRYEVFDHEMEGRLAADQTLRNRVQIAIDQGEFDVAAQPIFELRSGRVLGVELFIRVEDDHGVIAGADVLRLAREHSSAIDEAMLVQAAQISTEWASELGHTPARIHLNVSAQSLATRSFADLVRSVAADHGINASAFAFEVETTELAPVAQPELATIETLRDAGSAVVLDGFGLGPSSLALIDRMRPAMVKIAAVEPREFSYRRGHFDLTSASRSDEHNDRVIVALVQAVTSLGVAACVKRIERPELLSKLIGAGAVAGQGDLLAQVTSPALAVSTTAPKAGHHAQRLPI